MMLCWRPARKRHFLLLAVLACRVLGAQSPSAGTDLQAVVCKVALPPGWALAREAPAAAEPRADDSDNTARISLRLPESLKTDVEAAAARDGVSVNTWLVRAADTALAPTWSNAARMAASWAESAGKHGGSSHRVTGWING